MGARCSNTKMKNNEKQLVELIRFFIPQLPVHEPQQTHSFEFNNLQFKSFP